MLIHDTNCKACHANERADADDPYLVWRNDRWVLRHTKPPYAEKGWMTLHSERHAMAFTALSDQELLDLGPTLARISRAIVTATGALRVYIATMTETTPHFHAHLVPRYAEGPKGWETFKLKDAAKVTPRDINDDEVRKVIDRVRKELS